MSEDREQRNAVFGNTQNQSAHIPTTTAAEKLKNDFNFEIPVELVPLPSSGKVYPADSALAGLDLVEIKSMTAKEEDILTSRALLKKGTVITELIRSCLTDKRINPVDLLVGDRNALMVAIRITGYGPEYKAEINCPDCGAKNNHAFDLSELPIRRLEIDPVQDNTNAFQFTLPVSKKNVMFRFLTGRDEEEIAITAEKQKKLSLTTDSAVTTGLMYTIISIDGVTDRAKISNFIRQMPARDSLELRNFIRDNEPGIVMKQDATCDSCGHTEEVDMPIGVSFLWPSAGR